MNWCIAITLGDKIIYRTNPCKLFVGPALAPAQLPGLLIPPAPCDAAHTTTSPPPIEHLLFHNHNKPNKLTAMKSLIPYSVLSLASVSQFASAIVVPGPEHEHAFLTSGQQPKGYSTQVIPDEKRLIQLSPMETKWVTEDAKLELKRVCLRSHFQS